MSFVRELGAAERIYCREQTDFGNQTLVQALILSKDIHIDEITARNALLQLYLNHVPVLGYEVSPSDDRRTLVYKSKEIQRAQNDLMLCFRYEKVKEKRFSAIELRMTIIFLRFKDVDWRQVFGEELNQPFDDDNLSRWILVDGHILINSFHHLAVDGKNLFYIGEQFLNLCFSKEDHHEKQPIHLDAMEKFLINEYAFETISDLDLKPRDPRPNPIVSRTGLRHFLVDKIVLSRLTARCHEHEIRLNSILTVISAFGHYLASGKTVDASVKIHMMVNIRPQLNLDYKTPGLFVTVFDCFVSVNQNSVSSLWSTAIEQHQDLYDRINRKEYIENCKNDTDLLRLVNANEKFSCDDVHFAFSNLGVLTNSRENHLVEHYFGVSLIEQRWTSSILLGIGTVNDSLCFTFTYNKNQVSSNFIDKWIEKINFLLENI